MYILSRMWKAECLTLDYNRETASECTYFHLCGRLSVWHLVIIVREPWNVHTIFMKEMCGRKWYLSNILNTYIYIYIYIKSFDEHHIYMISTITDQPCLTGGVSNRMASTQVFLSVRKSQHLKNILSCQIATWYTVHTFTYNRIIFECSTGHFHLCFM